MKQRTAALLAAAFALGAFAAAAWADEATPPGNGARDWVQVQDGHFTLGGKPFIVRGINYFGSWRHNHTIVAGDGVEQVNFWSLYHDYDTRAISADFDFIRAQLNATAVRMATPTEADFDPLVRYHVYTPWYAADGSIAEPYRSELIQLADTAYAHGVRIQFCLLWGLSTDIARDEKAFEVGGRLDKRYATQVQSIAAALASHPGVFSFSIGNEVVVNWPINGARRSSFEGVATNFIARRIEDLRRLAPKQLITEDEGMHPDPGLWYSPGPEFAALLDKTTDGSEKSKRLVDLVDYLGPHFYPETLEPEDLTDGFVPKIDDAKRQLALYAASAKAAAKPIVLDEFGLGIAPSIVVAGESGYGPVRDAYIKAIVVAAEEDGLQGILAWDAIPTFDMANGNFESKLWENKANPNSHFKLESTTPGGPMRRILFYDPEFKLFLWRNDHSLAKTAAARTLANAWRPAVSPLK